MHMDPLHFRKTKNKKYTNIDFNSLKQDCNFPVVY